MAVVLTHDESSRLRALQALGLGPELETELQGIAAIAAQLFGTPRACFNVIDRDRVWAKAHFGGASEVPRGESLCEHLLDGAGTLVVSDAREDARFAGLPAVRRGELRFYAGVAIEAEGQRLGALCALGPAPLRPTAAQLEALGLLGKQLTAVLELRMLRARIQRAPLELTDPSVEILIHDLRSPLAAILTGAALLQRKGGLQPAHERVVDRIAAAASRIGRLADDLVDLARVRMGGGFPIRPVLTDAAALAARVLEEVRLAHEGRAIFLSVRADGWAELDPDRFAQALTNLVSNALAHGEADGAIDVAIEGEGHWLRLSVHNRGAPIPKDLVPKLFDPFRSGSASADGSGHRDRHLGLGLYIVRAIAQAHGGRVEVSSAHGVGTTFTLHFPRQAAQPH